MAQAFKPKNERIEPKEANRLGLSKPNTFFLDFVVSLEAVLERGVDSYR